MTITEQLAAIVPGKNYPKTVTVTEKIDGTNTVVTFLLCSYVVGMYCSILVNGKQAGQTGDNNNKRLCAGLKKDIQRAIDRGATVEIGSLFPVKTA